MMLLLILACASENSLSGYKPNEAAGGPDIKVKPTLVDFGEVAEGSQATDSFTILNQGDEGSVLHVDHIEIKDQSGSFTILTPNELQSGDIVQGESNTIDVAFTPFTATASGKASIYSDDPDEPIVEVDLIGSSAIPELQIDPDPLDMGQTYLGTGCEKRNEVTLTNVGAATLVINELEENGDGFSLEGSPSLPLTLEPGDSEILNVVFLPYVEGAHSATLRVKSNEPASPRTSDHTGEGVMAPEVTDRFELATDPPADIMFFVDQSCSMDDDSAALATNFSSFITQLNTYTTDWRIMVANDDNGCNSSGILTSASANYETRFSNAVQSGGGTWTEAGLTVAKNAIENTDAGECNAGFMRSAALLHIILVSDEPEQSVGSWSNYVNAIIAKKGSAGMVKISAIAGPVPGGCSSGGNSADPGTGYDDAATATNGEFLSICSSWSNHVGVLANASVTQETFDLSQEPIESTIKVFLNGNRRTQNWTYDSITNSITFSVNIPGEGDVVEFTYNPYVNCD